MDLTQISVAKMIASTSYKQPEVGSEVIFSCVLANMPDNPSMEHHAQICAKKWDWIDDQNRLTSKGLKAITA